MKVAASHLALMLVSTTSLTIATPAYAQDSESSVASKSEDIIVTARRRDELLQNVPISITVFNQQQLASRNVTNASDLALYTPSLSANTNFGAQNSTFAIRGFVQDNGTPPSVGVYFADVVAPRGPTQGTTAGDGAGPGMMFDLQNIQVLKGPQGTLQGRNTTGGSVLLVPRKPTDTLEGYVEASAGNYDMWRVQAAANIPLSDIARLRLAVDRHSRSGYMKNASGIGPDDFSDVNYLAARASFVVDLTANLENYTIASYSKSDTHGDLKKVIACNPTASSANFLGLLTCAQLASEKAKNQGRYTLQSTAFPNPTLRQTQWQIINTTTWNASDLIVLKNIVSYAEFRSFERSSLFGTNWFLAPGVPQVFAGINPAPGRDSASQNTFTEELQLQGRSGDGRLQYQGGAYLEISDPIGASGNLNPTFISCTNLNALQCTSSLGTQSNVNEKIGRTEFRNVGLFAQATYELAPELKLTGGVRYTWDSQKASVTNRIYYFPSGGAPYAACTYASSAPSCEISPPKAKSDAPTWLIGLDYKPTNDTMLYAKYSRGYRAGGVFPNSPSNYRIFEPEKVDAFEIGTKNAFNGPLRGTFNAAAFYNTFTNQQLSVGFTGVGGVAPTTGVVNAGKSRIYGVEVDASVSPFEGFRLEGGYTWLHARIVAFDPLVSNDPNYIITQTITPGDTLALSPDHKFTATAAYTLPLSEDIGQITLAATYSYRSSQLTTYAYRDPAVRALFGSDLGTQPKLGLLNLNFDWQSVASLPVDFSVFATNVTGKYYYTYVPGLAGYGFEAAGVGQPRMVGARIKYSFR